MDLRIVTISELRQHCNALTADDTILTQYGLAAEAYIIRYTRRTPEELKEMSEEDNTYPLEIKQAVLMLAAHLYRMREAVSTASQVVVPFGFNTLVRPFRKFSATWREPEEEEEEEETNTDDTSGNDDPSDNDENEGGGDVNVDIGGPNVTPVPVVDDPNLHAI